MQKETWYKLYFVLGSPILAKIIEWIMQSVSYNFFDVIKSVWFIQIFFILAISCMTYLFFVLIGKNNLYAFSFIVGIAYFGKEVFNHFIRAQTFFTLPGIIALTIEPIAMWIILGYLPYKWMTDRRKR
jgi:hypothetical protein